MNIETNPSTQMPPGNLRSMFLAESVDSGLFGCDKAMNAIFYAAQRQSHRQVWSAAEYLSDELTGSDSLEVIIKSITPSWSSNYFE